MQPSKLFESLTTRLPDWLKAVSFETPGAPSWAYNLILGTLALLMYTKAYSQQVATEEPHLSAPAIAAEQGKLRAEFGQKGVVTILSGRLSCSSNEGSFDILNPIYLETTDGTKVYGYVERGQKDAQPHITLLNPAAPRLQGFDIGPVECHLEADDQQLGSVTNEAYAVAIGLPHISDPSQQSAAYFAIDPSAHQPYLTATGSPAEIGVLYPVFK